MGSSQSQSNTITVGTKGYGTFGIKKKDISMWEQGNGGWIEYHSEQGGTSSVKWDGLVLHLVNPVYGRDYLLVTSINGLSVEALADIPSKFR